MADEKKTNQENIEETSEKVKSDSVNIALSKTKLMTVGLVVLLFIVLFVGMSLHEKKALIDLKNSLDIPASEEGQIQVNPEVEITAATLREVIAPAKELVSYKYYYTDAGQFEKDKKFFNTSISIPLTKNQQVYVCSGTIGVGLNIEDINFDIDNEHHKIIVQMPELKVLYHEMDTDNFQSYDVKSSVFTKVNLSDYADFQDSLKTREEEKLNQKNDFWKEARTNTENALEGLLTVSGLVDNYVIQFDWQ
ncbi:DUF4230 domain-containing protein [Butyrivibrio fibrisolvens]|uniref:DUF4230 domain-containing protein n=1 Tax=Pseudobutyrivibrio ruminis TaxID=46206 RepID=UPI00040D9338|nr:DUF4230 domain-containing protein [Pseudobutyrivibrio ruminis]MDC7278091.1 DUF4230 domain-containing protein [Butyrivibrio fibrisolvens]